MEVQIYPQKINKSLKPLITRSSLFAVLCFDDPGVVMMRCIDETSDLDYCAAQ